MDFTPVQANTFAEISIAFGAKMRHLGAKNAPKKKPRYR